MPSIHSLIFRTPINERITRKKKVPTNKHSLNEFSSYQLWKIHFLILSNWFNPIFHVKDQWIYAWRSWSVQYEFYRFKFWKLTWAVTSWYLFFVGMFRTVDNGMGIFGAIFEKKRRPFEKFLCLTAKILKISSKSSKIGPKMKKKHLPMFRDEWTWNDEMIPFENVESEKKIKLFSAKSVRNFNCKKCSKHILFLKSVTIPFLKVYLFFSSAQWFLRYGRKNRKNLGIFWSYA